MTHALCTRHTTPRAGLVRHERSSLDERSLVITVTDAGGDPRQRAADVPDAMLCQVGITVAQAAELIALCDEMYTSLTTPAQAWPDKSSQARQVGLTRIKGV